MNWSLAFVVAGVLAVIFVLKRLTTLSPQAARAYLKQGALVVDVRSPGEFNAGHLPRAVNIPLDELRQRLPTRVPDKNQVVLLHCLSGTRSGIARRALIKMGYTRAFNLGSFGRAKRIINAH